METLTYKGKATKGQNNTVDGFIYIHHFGTGWQELVFPTKAKAAAFAERLKGCTTCRNGKEMPATEHLRIEADEFNAVVYCAKCGRCLQA